MTFTGRYQVKIAWATEPFNPSPTWTDVTAWIRLDKSLSLQRGRQDNFSDIQAGRLTLTADNSDGRFTVGRSGSPYAPNVKIGRRIQVNIPDETGTLHTRFDGLITELPAEWEGGPGIENLAVVQASDILAWLGRQPELLSWTQQEMLADNPVALWSLADSSSVTQATDQAGQGAAPLQVVSQGDGTGAASAGGGVPLTEVQTSNTVAQQQQVQTTTFTNPGSFTWTAPLGTLISCDVTCVGGGKAGGNGSGGSAGTSGSGAEEAEEPALAVTPGLTYSGSVGAGGVPSGGSGGNTTFTGDSVTVTAHASGSGSTNTNHHSGASAGGNDVGAAGGGGSSGGTYQAGNAGVAAVLSSAGGAGGTAVTGGGAGGAGGAGAASGTPGAAPGGGGGGGGGTSGAGGAGGAGQVTIVYTYIPQATSTQNSSVSSWLFTPSASLGARILSGPLPTPVTAAGGFAAECWADFASFPAAAVSTYTTPGAITPWTAPPGITAADVICVAGGNAGTSNAGSGGTGAEEAEEPALAVTPNSVYQGSVGAPGVPSGGAGGNTTFTGDAVAVVAHASGSGSSNTNHHSGGSGGGADSPAAGGGGSAGGQYQAGNNGLSAVTNSAGGAGGTAVTGGGAGGAGGSGTGQAGTPGAAPGGGGGGGGGTSGAGGAGGPGQVTVTATLAQSTLLTLVNPRGQNAIAVWVTTSGHLQLASTSGYGTSSPTWTTVDAGNVPSAAFHVVIDVAVTTGIATLYVNDVSAGTVTLPAGASYTQLTVGGAYGAWLGGWNGSAGLAAIYPAPLSSTRVGVHYTAGTTGFIGTSTGNIIAKIASYVGLPSFYYTAPTGTTDPSYGLTRVSYSDLKGTQPLSQMQLYELAEGGVLSVSAAGVLTFADRASRYAAGAGGSSFVLSAGQYEPDTSYKSNDQYLCTEACYATTDIPGGYPVVNAAAELDYGPYIANAGSPASPQAAPFADAAATAGTYSTDDLMDAGWWQANIFGQPVTRIPALTVDLLTLPASEFSIASFYATDIGSPYQLTGLPSQAPDSTGQPLAAYAVMEGINETLDLGTHTCQVYTSPLAQNAAWIPGDALLGVLGTTDVIGRSQAPAALGPPYGIPPTFGSTLNRTGSVGAQDMRTLAVNIQQRLTPPLLIAEQATAQTLTTAAGQPVGFDTLAADTAGGMGTTATYTIQPGFAGWYWAAAVVQAATGTGSLGGLAVWFAVTLSGVTSQWHARSLPYLSAAPYIAAGISGKVGPFAVGDSIQVIAAWSGSAASVPLGTTDGGSMFTLMWEGST